MAKKVFIISSSSGGGIIIISSSIIDPYTLFSWLIKCLKIVKNVDYCFLRCNLKYPQIIHI